MGKIFGVGVMAAIVLALSWSVSKPGVEITHHTYFAQAEGMEYVCITDSTSVECLVFQGLLEQASAEAEWGFRYFDLAQAPQNNTTTWVLKKYQIKTLPTVVRLFDGELRDSYAWDPAYSEAETLTQLSEYFIGKGSSCVTIHNGSAPVDFCEIFLAFPLFIMAAVSVYLVAARERLRLVSAAGRRHFLMIFMTLVMGLHWEISAWRFGFGIRMESMQIGGALGYIGRAALLLVLAIYIGNITLCMRFEREEEE